MDEYLRSNQRLWDRWAEEHARSAFYDVEGFKRGGVRVSALEQEEVGPVAGQSLLHLQCSATSASTRCRGLDSAPS
jgi:hypothetical protein